MSIGLQVDVISSKGSIFSNVVKFVSIPGSLGAIGILSGHVPLVSQIAPGIARFVSFDNSEEKIFVAGGILEVQSDYVNVLVDTAIRAVDLDEAKALASREKAKNALKNANSKSEIATVEAELAMLAEQIRSIRKLYHGIR